MNDFNNTDPVVLDPITIKLIERRSFRNWQEPAILEINALISEYARALSEPQFANILQMKGRTLETSKRIAKDVYGIRNREDVGDEDVSDEEFCSQVEEFVKNFMAAEGMPITDIDTGLLRKLTELTPRDIEAGDFAVQQAIFERSRVNPPAPPIPRPEASKDTRVIGDSCKAPRKTGDKPPSKTEDTINYDDPDEYEAEIHASLGDSVKGTMSALSNTVKSWGLQDRLRKACDAVTDSATKASASVQEAAKSKSIQFVKKHGATITVTLLCRRFGLSPEVAKEIINLFKD